MHGQQRTGGWRAGLVLVDLAVLDIDVVGGVRYRLILKDNIALGSLPLLLCKVVLDQLWQPLIFTTCMIAMVVLLY